MSLPPELRVLCLQLSSTPVSELPRLTPTLLRHVLRCRVPLSNPATNVAKADASASSVQVHKLKTQLSSLLNGKSPEARFTAVVLIKAVVEVGGWEVLRGSEPWVRGMLSLLGKPDSSATKELCLLVLTKIYCMTHQYQSLVRELTTPTLPSYLTACLNLISPKSPAKALEPSSSLCEAVFRSFSKLVPRHTSLFRPFVGQIRTVSLPYLAPTWCDRCVTTPSMIESARFLVIALHQTAAKNAAGEEWGKAVRGLVKHVHMTANNVFRAVIEEWESTEGYVNEPVDISHEVSGGGPSSDGLPCWTGIGAGVERLTGLLAMLSAYFSVETSTPVSIPLGSIMDMITRMLSVAALDVSAAQGGARLNPGIDRDEKDGLRSGMPIIYIAALELVVVIARRLEEGFLSVAQGVLDQLAFIFPHGRHDPEFRLAAYQAVEQILLLVEHPFDQNQASKLVVIIRSCCKDLLPVDSNISFDGSLDADQNTMNGTRPSNPNADTILRTETAMHLEISSSHSNLVAAANGLLPLFLSRFPQQHLDISVRSLIERAAILSHNKDAMLACVLYPFLGRNGKASIIPHLTRRFAHDDVVEALLRPRMPLISSNITTAKESVDMTPEKDDMEMSFEEYTVEEDLTPPSHVTAVPGLGRSAAASFVAHSEPTTFQDDDGPMSRRIIESRFAEPTVSVAPDPPHTSDLPMQDDTDTSDDESVHLTMHLDTDSDDG